MDTRSFPGIKAAEAWRWPATQSSAKVKERVGLYVHSPSGPSWPVLGWTLLLPLRLPLPVQAVRQPVSVCNLPSALTAAHLNNN